MDLAVESGEAESQPVDIALVVAPTVRREHAIDVLFP
jgi:hypothetical protein